VAGHDLWAISFRRVRQELEDQAMLRILVPVVSGKRNCRSV
jgi:hypothetical protein